MDALKSNDDKNVLVTFIYYTKPIKYYLYKSEQFRQVAKRRGSDVFHESSYDSWI